MIRGLIRMMLVVVVVVAAAFFLFGYWSSGRFEAAAPAPAIDIDAPDIDTAKARQAGAEIGEKTAMAAARVSDSLEEGSLTAKIKAKMVLDDLVKARAIDVSTEDTVVTVAGTVHSQQERDRAVALAKETDGVTKVIDQLTVR